jgi:hypothetical protein
MKTDLSLKGLPISYGNNAHIEDFTLLIQIISFNFAGNQKRVNDPLAESPSLAVRRGWVKFRSKPDPAHKENRDS